MMAFNDLALYFDKLESTSSRLALIDILAEFFGKVEASEVSQVIYLLQGRIAPFYEPLEMGMAEKTVAASIGQAFNIDREKILKEYGKAGDLGKVAEDLKASARRAGKEKIKDQKLSIDEVFNKLKEIAQTKGEGTVEKRINILVGLLQKVSNVGAKHLVRIPLGVSRLGIGDPTILDAFAQSKLGDRKERKKLEDAYNRISDLGLIGEVLWEKGLEGVKKLDVEVGRPIRSQLCERLPDAKTILEKFGGSAHVQYKYDGFRTQLHLDRSKPKGSQVRIFSRNLEETTLMFPEIIEGVLKQVAAKTVILDAESLAFNPASDEFLPFQETTKRRRKYGISEMAKKIPLKAFVFDIMYLDGKSLVDLSLLERVKKIEEIISGDEILIPQPGEVINNKERMGELFDDALTKGLEGLVVKRLESKYEAGARNFNWVKLKRHSAGELEDTIDCVILGYIFGRGKRADFGAGSLLVGVYDSFKDEFVTVSKIGTGLSDKEWGEVHKKADKIKVTHKPARVNSLITPSVWVKPQIVIEVLADEITKSPVHTAGKTDEEPGYALRFPRLIRFRDDKKPEDITTVSELVEMYHQQYNIPTLATIV